MLAEKTIMLQKYGKQKDFFSVFGSVSTYTKQQTNRQTEYIRSRKDFDKNPKKTLKKRSINKQSFKLKKNGKKE